MNVSDILNSLGSVVNGGEEAGDIAQQAIDITNDFKANKLSQSEYQELISDLQMEKLVLVQTNQLALKEELDLIFSDVVSAAQILPLL